MDERSCAHHGAELCELSYVSWATWADSLDRLVTMLTAPSGWSQVNVSRKDIQTNVIDIEPPVYKATAQADALRNSQYPPWSTPTPPLSSQCVNDKGVIPTHWGEVIRRCVVRSNRAMIPYIYIYIYNVSICPRVCVGRRWGKWLI